VFCAFTKVTARAVRASGLVSALIVYVDDFGGSVGQHRDRERIDSTLGLIRSFGWVLVPDKVIDPMDSDIKLLGFGRFSFAGVTYVYNVLHFGLETSASVFCAFTEVTAGQRVPAA